MDHYLGEDLHHLPLTDPRIMAAGLIVVAAVIAMAVVLDTLKTIDKEDKRQ